jgi:hypothetical protein
MTSTLCPSFAHTPPRLLYSVNSISAGYFSVSSRLVTFLMLVAHTAYLVYGMGVPLPTIMNKGGPSTPRHLPLSGSSGRTLFGTLLLDSAMASVPPLPSALSFDGRHNGPSTRHLLAFTTSATMATMFSRLLIRSDALIPSGPCTLVVTNGTLPAHY